ncbi:polysaccharide biosynthesis protein, partial [Patescibacteria group bacterium]|nr:polysaccharide biosynthesis protein [Patescibacteria group bacterium]
GGEIYVAKIPSYKITDLAKALLPTATLKEVGIREGEKLHETMITEDDARTVYDYGDHYIIYPQADWWHKETDFKEGGKSVKDNFRYSSDTNTEWLDSKRIAQLLPTIKPD